MPVNEDAILEILNIEDGVFHPLDGFMIEKDYRQVVDAMHLANGSPWTIPVTLEVPEAEVDAVVKAGRITLVDAANMAVAYLDVDDLFRIRTEHDVRAVYGTDDRNHPGVVKELKRSPFRVGGRVTALPSIRTYEPPYYRTPAETKALFREQGWATVAGFQTRNPIHRAHEYLQRLAMEIVDGVFLQPLIGWKKEGDISPEAIILSYEHMIDRVYPSHKAVLGTLTTPMRYAGPREAVFHSLVRRNYGCTHFIVGRDHAGVGDYYGKYEAQALCRSFDDLGIQILEFCGPFYCRACGGVVTEKTCGHGDEHVVHVSGTEVRSLLSSGKRPPQEYMRINIADILIDLNRRNKLFIGG